MKLLVTGGCGFLGSNLAAAAVGRGDQVTVLDNLSRLGAPENLGWLRGLGLREFRHADIRNAADVESAVRDLRPDAVFHLAGQVAMTTSLEHPRRDFEVNALGTLNLLEAVRLHAPEAAVVYSSTNKVYGDLGEFAYREDETRYVCVDRPHGFDEQTRLDFQSPYGCSKGAADQYMLDYHRMFGLRTVVLRHSSMYGGRQFATADQGWIGWFCARAVEAARRGPAAEPFTIAGNGKQVRDVLHGDDMIRLYFAVLQNMGAAAGNAFNIGGGMENSLSLLELFAHLEAMLDTRLAYRRLPPRASDQLVFVADVRKAERLLGWTPRVDVRSGLERMLAWTRELAAA
jgi:CDP-paratose 2-epimerase